MTGWQLLVMAGCGGALVIALLWPLPDYDPEARYEYSYARFLKETPWCPDDEVVAHEIPIHRLWDEPEDARAARDALQNHGFTNIAQRVSGKYDVVRGECPGASGGPA